MNEHAQENSHSEKPVIAKWAPLPMEQWSPQERWVWGRVSTGKIADFNDNSLEFNRGGRELDPRN